MVTIGDSCIKIHGFHTVEVGAKEAYYDRGVENLEGLHAGVGGGGASPMLGKQIIKARQGSSPRGGDTRFSKWANISIQDMDDNDAVGGAEATMRTRRRVNSSDC